MPSRAEPSQVERTPEEPGMVVLLVGLSGSLLGSGREQLAGQ
jgi:hypothetical protein